MACRLTVTVQSQIYGALKGFINDLALSYRRVKRAVKQFCSSNQNQTCTYSESVSTFTWC